MMEPIRKKRIRGNEEAFAELMAQMHPDYALRCEMKAARARAALSQRQMAERSGMAQSVISEVESGQRPVSLRVMRRWARATGSRLVVRLEEE